jgi:regulator of protease activity HflC (stomatin/prohibitin superfamily)
MTTVPELIAGTAVEICLAAIALGLIYRVWGRVFSVAKRLPVLGFQRGVVLRGGVVEKVLKPGTYWIMPSQTLLLCDMRTKPFQVASQEVLTADKMGVRVSLGGEYKIGDPALFVSESSDPFGAFYLEMRQALMTAVAELSSESVFSSQAGIVARLRELLLPRATQLGIEPTELSIWEVVPLGWLSQAL